MKTYIVSLDVEAIVDANSEKDAVEKFLNEYSPFFHGICETEVWDELQIPEVSTEG